MPSWNADPFKYTLLMQSWMPVEGDGWGGQMEASLGMGDWITNVAYFSVVSICAPIWEEVCAYLGGGVAYLGGGV